MTKRLFILIPLCVLLFSITGAQINTPLTTTTSTQQATIFSANQGTAQTAGNIALGAGWGTGPTVTVVSGFSQTEQFTVTVGTTPAASPAMTVTFPNAFPTTPICFAFQVGGNQGIQDFTVGTVNTTSAAFTWNGTPTAANTVIVQVRCGP